MGGREGKSDEEICSPWGAIPWSCSSQLHHSHHSKGSSSMAGIFHLQSQMAQGCSEPVWDEGFPAENLWEPEKLWVHRVPSWESSLGWDGTGLKPLCCQQRDIPCSVTVLPWLLLSWSMLCSKEWGLEQNSRHIFKNNIPDPPPCIPTLGKNRPTHTRLGSPVLHLG